MSILALALIAAGTPASSWQPASGHSQIALWPGTPPDARAGPDSESVATAENPVGGKPWTYISKVSRPTLTVYPPKGNNTGVAMIVFPGGGYRILAIDLEGTEICDWLNSKGVTCVLLKYRVPKTGPSWDPDCRCFINPKPSLALEDAQRAVGLVRTHAAEWHIDPHKVGVIGFSAGGHLSAAISNDYRKRLYKPVDDADQQSCRPDFAVAVYPGHLWMPGQGQYAFNPDIHVTRDTPPTFLVQAETDTIDNVNQSLVYYVALKDAGVPAEMHLYADGGHAFGLRRTKDPITEWPDLVEKWLRTIGMLPK
jgi:acetyl esterase/lipase